jgi:hypothetical protein
MAEAATLAGVIERMVWGLVDLDSLFVVVVVGGVGSC